MESGQLKSGGTHVGLVFLFERSDLVAQSVQPHLGLFQQLALLSRVEGVLLFADLPLELFLCGPRNETDRSAESG